MITLKKWLIPSISLFLGLFTIGTHIFAMELKSDPTVRDMLITITEKLNQRSELLDEMDTDYQFNLGKHKYQIAIHDNQATFSDGTPWESDCIIIISEANFKKLISGELDPYDAYFSGKLKIKGDLNKAITLLEVLKQLRK